MLKRSTDPKVLDTPLICFDLPFVRSEQHIESTGHSRRPGRFSDSEGNPTNSKPSKFFRADQLEGGLVLPALAHFGLLIIAFRSGRG